MYRVLFLRWSPAELVNTRAETVNESEGLASARLGPVVLPFFEMKTPFMR